MTSNQFPLPPNFQSEFETFLQSSDATKKPTGTAIRNLFKAIIATEAQEKAEPGKKVVRARTALAAKRDLKSVTQDAVTSGFKPNTECVFITKNTTTASKKIGPRTLSWCILDPRSTDSQPACIMNLCFDVDEVRTWIADNAKTELERVDDLSGLCRTDKTASKNCSTCPMFVKEQIDAALKAKELDTLIVIPADMPGSFREVITNFESLAGFTAEMHRDVFADGVRKHVQMFLAKTTKSTTARLSETSYFGTFWNYTKKAIAPLVSQETTLGWNLSWMVMDNPFYVLVITALMRMVRIFLTVYTSFPATGSELFDTIANQLLTRTEDGKTNNGLGIVDMVVKFTKVTLACLKSTTTSNLDTLIAQCARDFEKGTEGSVANVVAQFVAPVLQGAMHDLGLSYVSDFGQNLFAMPGSVIDSKWREMDQKEEASDSLKTTFAQLGTHQWNVVATLFFLANSPTPIVPRIVFNLLPYMPLPLIPIFASVQANQSAKINPVVIFEWLVTNTTGTAQAAIIHFVDDMADWVFNLLPCLFGYLSDALQFYLGLDGPMFDQDGAKVVGTCAMTKIVQDLQRAAIGDGDAAVAVGRARTYYDRVKGRVLSYFGFHKKDGSAGTSTDLQKAIDLAIARMPISNQDMGKDVKNPSTNLMIPRKLEADLVPAETVSDPTALGYFGNAFKALGRGLTYVLQREPAAVATTAQPEAEAVMASATLSMLATEADEREKNLLYRDPVYVMTLPNGKQVKFYMLAWKKNAPFYDGYAVHMAVLARDMEEQFPGSIVEFHGRRFVLLHRLPIAVTKRILQFENPVVDMRLFTQDE